MVEFHCTLTTFSAVALSHFSDAGKRFDWVPAVLCSLTFHRLISLLFICVFVPLTTSSLPYLLRSFPLLITSPYPPPLFPSGPSIFLLYITFCAPSLFSSLHLTLHLSSPLVPPFSSLALSLSSVQAATSLMMKSLLRWRSLRSQKSWQRVGWPICWTVMYVTYHRKSFALTLTWFAMVG